MSEDLAPYTESFGDYLKRHREASGKSLDEIARTTKISKRYLEAFESTDLNNLPEEAFARGFLKNYAAEIGIDVEECLDRYERFRRSIMPTQVKDMKKVTKPSLLLGTDSSGIKLPSWLPMAILGVAIVVLIGFGFWFLSLRSPGEGSVARESAQVVVEESDELGASSAEEAGSGFAAPIPPSILTIRALDTSTVLLRIDESAAQEVVIEKASEKSFEVYRQIEIRNLNQNKLKLEYNGKPIEAAGPMIKLFNQNMFSK